MDTRFYVRRYLAAFVIATVVIGVAQYLKGHSFDYAIREGLTWGAISSLVYTSVLAYKLRHLRAAARDSGPDGNAT